MQVGQWHAAISDVDFMRRRARLLVGHTLSEGRFEYLLEDGTMLAIGGEEAAPPNAGLLLPYPAIDAIYEAVEVWKGLQSHAATETKVLREWLEVERGRVDDLHYRTLDRLIGEVRGPREP